MAASPSKLPTKKVAFGAAAGGAIGTPVSVILVYLLGSFGHPLPADVAAAISSLITISISFAASYIIPPEEPPQPTPTS